MAGAQVGGILQGCVKLMARRRERWVAASNQFSIGDQIELLISEQKVLRFVCMYTTSSIHFCPLCVMHK